MQIKDGLLMLSELSRAAATVKSTGMLKNFSLEVIKKARALKREGNLGVGELFTLHALGIPERTALIYKDEKISYRELNARMNRGAHALLALGLKPGERIILMVSNCNAYVELVGAVGKMGGSLVPVSTSLKAAELAYILNNSGSRAILCSEKYLDTVRQALAEAPMVDPGLSVVIGKDPDNLFNSYADLLSRYPDTEVDLKLKEVESPVILYTSGTTGRPKGAVRNFKEVNPLVFLYIMSDFKLSRDDVIYTPCPLYHAAPTAFLPLCLMLGGTFLIGESFEAQEVLNIIEKHRVTLALMVPTHYQRLMNLPREEFSRRNFKSLRGLISTGSNFPPPLKAKVMEAFGPLIYDLYGATEIGMAMLAKPEDVVRHPNTIGKPMTGNRIRLINDQGREADEGELYVWNSSLFQGYFKNPSATSAAAKEKFYTVGDVARRDRDGYYFLCDRKADMVISGGVNVYPKEIEDELMKHPSLEDVGVVGAPDEEWGEILVAFAVLRSGEQATEEELKEFVGKNLARYKKPKAVFFVPELPRSQQGKMLKKELKKWLAEGKFIVNK